MALPNSSWDKLPVTLLDPVRRAIRKLGFQYMTPVQATCIPLFLNYKDVAAEAVTGSGKTLAFLVPIIQILLKRETPLKKYDIGALIILPTRELAEQIHEVLQTFLNEARVLTSLLFIGGKSVSSDLMLFRSQGSHIIISTPGRLQDLLDRKVDEGPSLSAGLRSLDVLVLDEADRLLDCGFNTTLNTILAYLPKLRRTGIFSATQTNDVTNLIRAGMRNPVQIRVKEKNAPDIKTPSSLTNFYMPAEVDCKIGHLLSIIMQRLTEKIMVFFSTCACVEYFTEVLKKTLPEDTILLSLHGKMKQKRFKIFDQFRQMKSAVLLCTDVLCRGVDIPSVDWVIQFDPPSSARAFVHRCGRTARNGVEGSAIIILQPNEMEYVKFIEINQKVQLLPFEPPEPFLNILDIMRRIQLEDRAVMDKANRAFVSNIKAYTKHECSILLDINKLNLGQLATGFGLLKLPRMPELKNYKSQDFVPYDIDLNLVKYLDKNKESERQNKLMVYKQTGKWPGMKTHKPKQTESWFLQKDKAKKKKLGNEIKQKISSKHVYSEKEFEDLDNDYRMIKKFKKGKLAEKVLAKHFGLEEEKI